MCTICVLDTVLVFLFSLDVIFTDQVYENISVRTAMGYEQPYMSMRAWYLSVRINFQFNTSSILLMAIY